MIALPHLSAVPSGSNSRVRLLKVPGGTIHLILFQLDISMRRDLCAQLYP